MNTNAFIQLDDGIMVSIGLQPYTVEKSHKNYEKVLDAIKSGDWDVIPDLVNVSKAVSEYVSNSGRITVNADAGVVLYMMEDGNEITLNSTISSRILRMMEEGFSATPLITFLDNLMENPSKRAVDELYGFLEFGKMPITEDGHFLAYKRVMGDYKSVHDGKTDNSIGNIVEMPRNMVDDNKDQTCSYGLHFCSHGYLSKFSGERVVVLKINPRDVVSIPTDYNNTKGRACRYEVVGELTQDEIRDAMDGNNWNESVNGEYDVDGNKIDADRDWDDVPSARDHDDDAEIRSASYIAGYKRGRVDGRNGTSENSAVVVMDYVANTEEYIDGYKRGHKDGKGHKAMVKFQEQELDDNDEYQAGYDDGFEDGSNDADNENEYDAELMFAATAQYANGYTKGYSDGYSNS